MKKIKKKTILAITLVSSIMILTGCTNNQKIVNKIKIKKPIINTNVTSSSQAQLTYLYQQPNQTVMLLQLQIIGENVNGTLVENYINNGQIIQMTNIFSGIINGNSLNLNFASKQFGTIQSQNTSVQTQLSSDQTTITINLPTTNGQEQTLTFQKTNLNTYNEDLNALLNVTSQTQTGNQTSNQISTANTQQNLTINQATNNDNNFSQQQALAIAKKIPGIINSYKNDKNFSFVFQNANPIKLSNGDYEYTIVFGDNMPTNFAALDWINVRSDGKVQNGISNGTWQNPKNYN